MLDVSQPARPSAVQTDNCSLNRRFSTSKQDEVWMIHNGVQKIPHGQYGSVCTRSCSSCKLGKVPHRLPRLLTNKTSTRYYIWISFVPQDTAAPSPVVYSARRNFATPKHDIHDTRGSLSTGLCLSTIHNLRLGGRYLDHTHNFFMHTEKKPIPSWLQWLLHWHLLFGWPLEPDISPFGRLGSFIHTNPARLGQTRTSLWMA
ncbi:hypothetical protein V8F06_007963 [Rhypophila decipiens]